MPIARNYKPGSIIYFEKDKNPNEIFILQKGRVILLSPAIDTGYETKETIATGEFFGVKSVLGKYPREATAQVTAQTIVLVLKPEEFEQMVIQNFRILMKMLKVFSNQLRRVGKTVRELLHKEGPKVPATELFNIGDYYFKKGKAAQAKYVYTRYLEVYPNGQFQNTAQERLNAIEKGDFSVQQEAVTLQTTTEPDAASSSTPSVQEEAPPYEEEKPKTAKIPEGIDITKKFYEGLSLFSQDKFEEAMEIYDSIGSVTRFKDEQTAKFAEKSLFEKGRCLIKMDKPLESIETFSNLIKKFQKTDLLKNALFNIGEAYEKLGKYDKAINFYQKVVNTPPKESINSKAKKAIEEAQRKI